MPYQITTAIRPGGSEHVRCAQGHAVTHPTDAPRRLFRRMLAAGLPPGPAEVRGEDGRLRLSFPCIATAARWVRVECPERGFRLRPYRPHPGTAPPRGQGRRQGCPGVSPYRGQGAAAWTGAPYLQGGPVLSRMALPRRDVSRPPQSVSHE